ncbi:hypothetical protein GN958_ATG08090 [Phytophthora infestans]|uniref:Uncharacterized protein n=1 Tax=Phytophthora infestans TaxID=4787 RepID=A0A8S9UX52_PHYIN|nr:hypothetical protein GN958_ATG08090 [Phytophthora infestans]
MLWMKRLFNAMVKPSRLRSMSMAMLLSEAHKVMANNRVSWLKMLLLILETFEHGGSEVVSVAGTCGSDTADHKQDTHEEHDGNEETTIASVFAEDQ